MGNHCKVGIEFSVEKVKGSLIGEMACDVNILNTTKTICSNCSKCKFCVCCTTILKNSICHGLQGSHELKLYLLGC